MIQKEKDKHQKELVIELNDIEISDEYLIENESPYLIDYLYGISDVEEEVKNIIKDLSLEDRWIILYRCILKKEYLKGKYDKFRMIGKNIFLIRNKEDIEIWKNKVLSESKIDYDLNERVEETLLKIKEEFRLDKLGTDESLNELKKILEKYYINEKTEKCEKIIYEMSIFLKRNYKEKMIYFSKTRFFRDILKLNNEKINKIQKKYGE